MDPLPNDPPPEISPLRKWLTSPWTLTVISLVFLIIAFYVEENWRGTVIWQQAQNEAAAAGISLDPHKYIPPEIPDDQNFGALPIFRMDPDPTHVTAAEMNRAFAHTLPTNLPINKDYPQGKNALPYVGFWSKGESPDVPAIKKRLIEICNSELTNPNLQPDATPTDFFSLLCPVLSDLRAANPTHPYCRFDLDYATQPAFNRPLGGITSMIGFAKVLSYEERLAFLDNKPELVLEDLKIGWKVDSGLRQEPNLIAGLVSCGVVAIQLGVVTEGLSKHVWNDQQLTDLDNDLGKIDYLTESQFCVRGETVVLSLSTVNYLKTHRSKFQPIYGIPSSFSSSSLSDDLENFLYSSLAVLAPNGWFEEFKAADIRFKLLGTVNMVDPVSRRFFPEKEAKTMRAIQDLKASSYWRNFLTQLFSPIISSVKNFAYSQVRVDEARISCRLERYHLVHGIYPDSLQALIPTYSADLSLDVMNGQPYHYRLLKDGTYRLYSVGWDQTDDGGEFTGLRKDEPDWVWGNHPEIKAAK